MIINCRCGTPLEVDDDMLGEEIQCPRCQATMIAPAQSAPAQKSKPGAFTATPPPPRHPSFPPQPAPPASFPQALPGTTSSKATTCLNLGISSFTVPFLLAIPSILFGILALRECRRYRMQGKSTALMGMTLAVAFTLFWAGVVWMAYPWIKQAIDLSNGLKGGGDITKFLPKGAAGIDGGDQIKDPKTKADYVYAQGMLKFGDPGDLHTLNRLREMDMNRLKRIENALKTANTWKELLATP